MNPAQKNVHVNPTGENWEVESEVATLAQAETKEQAIEAARDAAPEVGADRILVHTSDGLVEKEIPLPLSPDETAARQKTG
jgi:hypothetical protein